MTAGDELDLYETAYLVAGPPRVALVALVALCEERRVAVSTARHRVDALVREPADDMERAVLDAVPDAGRLLGKVLREVERSDAVADVRESLVERGLLSRLRWPGAPGRTGEGRRERDRLVADASAKGLRAVAAGGAEAIADARLRRVFTTPDPEPVQVRDKRRFGGLGGRDTPGLGRYTGDGHLGQSSDTGSDSGGSSGV